MRTPDALAALDRYLDLKAQLYELKQEIDALKPKVYDALTSEPDGRFAHRGVVFQAAVRHTYTYSAHVDALNDKLRTLKKQEVKNGTAQIKSATGYVVVRKAPAARSSQGTRTGLRTGSSAR